MRYWLKMPDKKIWLLILIMAVTVTAFGLRIAGLSERRAEPPPEEGSAETAAARDGLQI
jgi:hypothetical protein